MYTEKDLQRFWSKVDKSDGEDSCWNWTGRKAHEYGILTWGFPRTRMQATHIAWEIYSGEPFPREMQACHSCDNPRCVNPKHLFCGTMSENMKDKIRKGRTTKGEKLPQTRLSDVQVAEIRSSYEKKTHTQYELADMYGVYQGHISAIVNHKKRN